jgi:hypothetical protein
MGSGERCAIESLTIGRSTAAETIPAAVDARHFGFRNAGNKRERCRKRYQTNRLHSFSRAGDAAPGFQKQNGCGRNAAKGTAFLFDLSGKLLFRLRHLCFSTNWESRVALIEPKATREWRGRACPSAAFWVTPNELCRKVTV